MGVSNPWQKGASIRPGKISASAKWVNPPATSRLADSDVFYWEASKDSYKSRVQSDVFNLMRQSEVAIIDRDCWGFLP